MAVEHRPWITLVAVPLFCFATGCSRYADLTGQVVDNGKPLSYKQGASEPPVIRLACNDEGRVRTVVCGLTPDDGRFVVYSPDGNKGLLPGKYRIGFSYGEATPKAGADFLPDEATLEIDVEAGQRISLIVDAAKRTLTRE